MKAILFILLYGFAVTIPVKPTPPRQVEKGNMVVNWVHHGEYIQFTLEAPTKGWLAIGFNETENISGSYLIMARMNQGKAEVIEFKTLAPGNYKPIVNLGGKSMVISSEGKEKNETTNITLSIKTTADNGLQKDLSEGEEYCLHMAYSQDKDFQHHSVMRTSVQVEL
jgi:hypothetical protein